MKKLLLFVLFLILFLASDKLFSQKAELIVLAKSGDVVCKKKNSSKWEKVAITDKLSKGSKIKINAGGYLSLIHTNGGYLEIYAESSTEYDVSKLSKSIESEKTGLSKRFVLYLVNKISGSSNILSTRENLDKSLDSDELTDKRMAVERSIELNNFTPIRHKKAIQPRLPRATYVLDPMIRFSWYKFQNIENYEFKITDNNEKVIFNKVTKDTTTVVNFQELNLRKGECYYWSISDEDGEYSSDEYCLYWLTDSISKHINDTLNIISQEFTNKNSSIQQLYLASFLEEKSIIYLAEQAYKQAWKNSPQIIDYKRYYIDFLKRIGLVEEANYLSSELQNK